MDESSPSGAPQAPDIAEAFRELRETSRAGFSAAKDAGKSLRTLVAADVSLARSAFGRTLAFTGAAIAFGATAWMMLMGATVAALVLELGWSWMWAMLATAAFSIVVTVFAGWRAITYFEHTRMKATRRQLARLGIGELAKVTPDAGSAASVKDVTEHLTPDAPAAQAVKTEQGVDVTAP